MSPQAGEVYRSPEGHLVVILDGSRYLWVRRGERRFRGRAADLGAHDPCTYEWDDATGLNPWFRSDISLPMTYLGLREHIADLEWVT